MGNLDTKNMLIVVINTFIDNIADSIEKGIFPENVLEIEIYARKPTSNLFCPG